MKKLMIFFGILFMFSLASAVSETQVYYFYSTGCSHCQNVEDSGILASVDLIENVSVEKFETSNNPVARAKFLNFTGMFEIDRAGVPFAVIEQAGEYSYLMGDTPIIEDIEDAIVNFESMYSAGSFDLGGITLSVVIVAAIIDSINPCAFGVLLFLMLSLLNMGSSKRALKAGLLYTFVVFLVYFSVGLGLIKILESFQSLNDYFYIAAGVLILVLGAWQFKDVLFPNFGPSLAISSKSKPLIEKFIRKGTIPAMIVLGILVSLFELPCTGGIYLGILSLMSIHKVSAVSYLLIYNVIFVLPLIILTLLVYKGLSPEILQKWTLKERKLMKIGSGIVLILLGLYILL